MTSKSFGYVRVSTQTQSLDAQVDALVSAGVADADIYADKASGASADRDGLNRLLEVVREGDILVVPALDRLGRSLKHMLTTIELLRDRGVVLRSLRENLDLSTPTGQLMAAIFASLAEYERSLMLERAASAREAAAARGKQTGRPRALSPENAELARRMKESGESVRTIASTLSVSRATVYRVVADAATSVVRMQD